MDDDLDDPIAEPKISGGATRTLNALLDAAAKNAYAGGMRPDEADEARLRYAKMVRSMRTLIARLENAGIRRAFDSDEGSD